MTTAGTSGAFEILTRSAGACLPLVTDRGGKTLFAVGDVVPPNGAWGFAPGGAFLFVKPGLDPAIYINQGTETACAFQVSS